MYEQIYLGIDAGFKRKGFEVGSGAENYFTIAGVTCTNMSLAEEAVKRLDERWPGKKGKNLHGVWKEVIKILTDYQLRYYVLLFDKKSSSIWFQKNFRTIQFPESTKDDGYNAIYDQYAKHGWLIVDIWRLFGYKGNSEIRVDRDLQGKAWDLYKKKVKDHAENCFGKGSCDIQDAGDEYPLIRIADIIANFSHWHLKDKQFMQNMPEIVYVLEPLMLTMELSPEPNFRMEAKGQKYFLPWEY